MTSSITPNPAIHTMPALDSGQFTALDWQQLIAWGQTLLTEIEQAVAFALLNVSVLGVKPFAALQQFGSEVLGAATDLQTLIDDIGSGDITGVVSAIDNLANDISSLISGVGGAVIGDVVTAIDSSINNFIALISGIGGSNVADVVHLLLKIQQLIDGIANALGHLGTGFSVTDIVGFLQNIPMSVIDLAEGIAVDSSDVITAITGTTWFTDLTNALGLGGAGLGTGGLSFPSLSGIPLLGDLVSVADTGVVDAITGTTWFGDLQSLLGSPLGLGTGSPSLPGIGSIPLLNGVATIDGLVQAWGGISSGYALSDLANFAQNIAPQYVVGTLGGATVESTFQNFVDAGVQAITNIPTSINNFMSGWVNQLNLFSNHVGYTVGGDPPPPASLTAITQTHSEFIAEQAIYKATAAGIDQTADAPYNIDSLFIGGLPTKPITDKAALWATIPTPHAGVKQSVRWLGYPTGGSMVNISGLYVHIWKYNPASPTKLVGVHQSANLASVVGTGTTPVWNSYNLPSSFTSSQGDLYLVQISIYGSGTYNICGVTGSITTGGMPLAVGGGEFYGPDHTCEAHVTTSAPLTGVGSNISATLTFDNGGDSGVIIATTTSGPVLSNFSVFVGTKQATLLGSVALGGNTAYNLALWYVQNTPSSPIGSGSQTVQIVCNVGASPWVGALNAVNIWGAAGCAGILTASGVGANCSLSLNGAAGQDWNQQWYFAGAADATTWSGSGQPASPNGGFLVTGSDVSGTFPLALGFSDMRFFPTITNSRNVATGNTALIAVPVQIDTTSGTVPVEKGLPYAPSANKTSNMYYDTPSPWIGLSGTVGATTYAPVWLGLDSTITGYLNPAATFPWANHFDILVCDGGGGGGDAANPNGLNPNSGGTAGTPGRWSGATLSRAQMGTSPIDFYVGAAGAGSTSFAANGQPGTASAVVIPGFGTLSGGGPGSGGITGGSPNQYGVPGAGAANLPYTDAHGHVDIYYGGPGGASASAVGSPPGGAGAGGNSFYTYANVTGGSGGRGIIYMKIYQ